jgi:DNA-binding NtrC family response regulator
MQQIRTLVRQVAASTLPVLVRGETGTGKELVARAIHGESSHREAPFVTVNCGAIPRELLEAELLGYSRGAFTGAERDHPGLLLSAQGGTFLFDEMIIPPLRERLEDLPELVEHFRVVAGGEIALPAFDENALSALAAHSWPGNIRELRTIIIRLALKTPERIRAEDVRALLGETPARGMFPPALLRSRPLDQLRSLLEKEYLVQLHSTHGGDLKAMAAHLGITLQGLYKRLKALGIRPRELPQKPQFGYDEPPG